MIKLLTILINFSFAQEALVVSKEEPVFSAQEYRCQFLSRDQHIITHQFKWYEWEPERRCEYGVKVDGKVILVSTAFTHECQQFMQVQVARGSLCLLNSF